MDVIDHLAAAYDHGRTVFGAITDDQLGDATPCPNFDVAALADHTVGVIDAITAGIGGDGTSGPGSPGERFAAAAERSLAAWRALGSLDAPVTMPWGESTAAQSASMGLADVLAHTWDAAVATGQDRDLPEGPAQAALDFTRGMLRPEFRSDAPDAAFGPEVSVADDASITDRLVGWLGRNPNA